MCQGVERVVLEVERSSSCECRLDTGRTTYPQLGICGDWKSEGQKV